MQEFLPWLNLCLPPLLLYVVRIENRITRLEAQREAERDLRGILPCNPVGAGVRG